MPSGLFFQDGHRRLGTTHFRPRDDADARFLILQKWLKMTPNDLFALKIDFTKLQRITEQNTLLISKNSVYLSNKTYGELLFNSSSIVQ